MNRKAIIQHLKNYYEQYLKPHSFEELEMGCDIAESGAIAASESGYIFNTAEEIQDWVKTQFIEMHADEMGLTIEQARNALTLYENYVEWRKACDQINWDIAIDLEKN